jgi:23S rRNA (cytidine1920-2'-O)/16S rRNA (cytidine1409-2'-O)-methyltransferase
MKTKPRLDQLLVDRGLAPSREKAKALVLAGEVLVDDRPAEKAGAPTDPEAALRLRHEPPNYVSRGGDKLAGALDAFGFDPAGKSFLDVGQSTGGFTDLLLQRGAVFVAGVDVGYGQLAMKLRRDPRVQCLERTNARELPAGAFGGKLFDGAAIDVSFISLRLVLPAALPHVRPGGAIVALVKPQFEAGREHVGKGGVVRDAAVIARCVDDVAAFAATLGLTERGRAPSRLEGPKGNREVFLWLEKNEQASAESADFTDKEG